MGHQQFHVSSNFDHNDILLSQWFPTIRFRDPLSRLALAVVEGAITDARNKGRRAEALAWLNDESDRPFSVTWIAGLLGLDPGETRARLRALTGARRRKLEAKRPKPRRWLGPSHVPKFDV